MQSFSWKKGCCKKKEKELIHIGIAPLSIKVSESRKSKSGLEKKTLLLFLSTTAFSNWRGKPSSAKHKLHPNGFCLYLIPRKKSQMKSRLMSSVLSTIYILYSLNKSFTFYKWGEGSGLGRLLACLLCRMASSLVMKTSSSRKLQWPFKKQGGRKEEEKKKRKSCNKLSKVCTKCGIEIIFQWAFSLIFMHLQFDEVFINFPTFSRSIFTNILSI